MAALHNPMTFNPLFFYKLANDYQGFVTNAAQLAELRKRFEGYSGPVVNTGGVR